MPSQALIFEHVVPGTGADVCSCRQALDVKSHAPLQFALCLLLAVEDLSSQLPALASMPACCHAPNVVMAAYPSATIR